MVDGFAVGGRFVPDHDAHTCPSFTALRRPLPGIHSQIPGPRSPPIRNWHLRPPTPWPCCRRHDRGSRSSTSLPLSLALEICRNHLGRDPSHAEISGLRSRFAELLCDAVGGTGKPLQEVSGAAALLHWLRAHPRWQVAIATGGWKVSARFKLGSAGLGGNVQCGGHIGVIQTGGRPIDEH